MSSDSQFTAHGPTQIGFQCNGANIRVGGTMIGTANGVEARCGTALGTSGAAVHAQSGYSQLTVVPWLVKVFTPRVGRRCEAGYELDSEQGCDSRARFF